jgi:hypothetical protein
MAIRMRLRNSAVLMPLPRRLFYPSRRGRGQNLCDVHHSLGSSASFQSTLHVHQAACVAHNQRSRPAGFEVPDLALKHFGRQLWVLH